jgi:hypothetical protein
MTLPPLAAGVGIEGIIWVIILIFWSIAQYVQKNRAAQRRPPMRPGVPPPPPTRPPTQMETELQDLLRELTGQPPLARDEEFEDEPPAQPVPPPVQQRAPPPPPVVHKTLATARKAAQVQTPPAPVRRPPVLAEPAPIPALPDYIAAVGDLSEGMGAAFQHSGKMPGLTLNMRNVSLRGVSYSGSGPARNRQSAIQLSTLRNPANLRQIVVGRLILDKPKALETGGGF